jgi:general secretion pathway protein B
VREAPARATAQAPQVAPKPTTQAATPAARVPAMSELPDEIKRDLPQLTIGGAMYSDTPSSRMLIINSQVFHEGDQPYQGLVLEEIRLKSAVFRYRGYRYAINY